jgi:hypothetical protein
MNSERDEHQILEMHERWLLRHQVLLRLPEE